MTIFNRHLSESTKFLSFAFQETEDLRFRRMFSIQKPIILLMATGLHSGSQLLNGVVTQ